MEEFLNLINETLINTEIKNKYNVVLSDNGWNLTYLNLDKTFILEKENVIKVIQTPEYKEIKLFNDTSFNKDEINSLLNEFREAVSTEQTSEIANVFDYVSQIKNDIKELILDISEMIDNDTIKKLTSYNSTELSESLESKEKNANSEIYIQSIIYNSKSSLYLELSYNENKLFELEAKETDEEIVFKDITYNIFSSLNNDFSEVNWSSLYNSSKKAINNIKK